MIPRERAKRNFSLGRGRDCRPRGSTGLEEGVPKKFLALQSKELKSEVSKKGRLFRRCLCSGFLRAFAASREALFQKRMKLTRRREGAKARRIAEQTISRKRRRGHRELKISFFGSSLFSVGVSPAETLRGGGDVFNSEILRVSAPPRESVS
jgi:hypothetical protein